MGHRLMPKSENKNKFDFSALPDELLCHGRHLFENAGVRIDKAHLDAILKCRIDVSRFRL